MIESAPEETHYTVLGVMENATTEEIKHAYFRLVRTCRPKENPEQFQRLNEARDILSDPRRRSEYDQNNRNGRRVRVLVDQAAVALHKDPQKTLTMLKSAVALAPEMVRPRALLAQLLMQIRDYPLAERQYRWLLERERYGQEEQLRCRLARCLLLQKKFEEVEEELKTVLRLNPAYHDALLLRARLYREQGRTGELVDTLEQAILNDGVENFSDFNTLLQLLLVHIQQENQDAIAQAGRRLRAIVPAERAVDVVEALLRLVDGYVQDEAYQIGYLLLGELEQLALPEPAAELHTKVREQRRKAQLAREAQLLSTDTLITGAIQECFQVLYRDHSMEGVRESRMDAVFARLHREYEIEPRNLMRRIDYLRHEYPEIAQEQDVFLSQLRERCAVRAEQQERQHLAVASAAATEPEPERRRGGLLGRILGAR